MQLYLVRHGQSANNANIDHPSRRVPDPPLTDLGMKQAALLADYLIHQPELDRASDTLAWRYGGLDQLRYRIHRLVTSPMHRALQTTAPLADKLNVPVKVWVELHERGGMYHYDSGVIQGHMGLTRAQIREQFPHYDLPTTITARGWWLGQLEPEAGSRQRARGVAQRLRDQARDAWRGQGVMLVGHAAFMDMLLKALMGTLSAETQDDPLYFFYNTSVSRIDFWDDGRLAVRYLNRVDHLLPSLIS